MTRRTLITLALIIILIALALAEVVIKDSQGNAHFTDDLTQVPASERDKVNTLSLTLPVPTETLFTFAVLVLRSITISRLCLNAGSRIFRL